MEIFGIYVNKIRTKATEKALEAIKILIDKGFKCVIETDIFKIVPEEFKSNIIEKNLTGICKNADVVLSFQLYDSATNPG